MFEIFLKKLDEDYELIGNFYKVEIRKNEYIFCEDNIEEMGYFIYKVIPYSELIIIHSKNTIIYPEITDTVIVRYRL